MKFALRKMICALFGVAVVLTVTSCSTVPAGQQSANAAGQPAQVQTKPVAEPALRSRDDLVIAFDNHEWDLRAIFRDVKAGNPEIDRGHFTVVVVIEPNGTVSEAEVLSSQFDGEPFLENMRQAVLRWRFPAGNYARMKVSNSFELR